MQTYTIGPIWGGILTYAGSQSSAVMEALHDYITNYDPKSSIIVSCGGGANSSVDLINTYVFYNSAEPPTHVFEKFLSIPLLNNATTTQNYSKLITSNGDYGNYGTRWLIRGQTFPNLPAQAGVELYKHHYNAFKASAAEQGQQHPSAIYSTAFQPFPAAIARASVAAGGNVIGSPPGDGDKMWIDYTFVWADSSADGDAYDFARDIVDSEEAYAMNFHPELHNTNSELDGKHEVSEKFCPLNMNNAQPDQPVLQSYGLQTYDWLRTVQRKYDPEGLWFRQGGFKYV
ncbi:hypothetical protein SLS56_009767 [Neofusicoccum ribis]|uniref:Berberine/berberine-like domain-containing protein n=1 Tax=Neofusicoccum ribis TaxID=45134 RepID=A0ABR3SGB8_9PEZI